MMRIAALWFCVLLAGPLGAQGPGAEAPLQPGDIIELAAWRDSSLSGIYPVDERGRVMLPLIGERTVTGSSWQIVRDSLLAAYARELRAGELRLTPKRRVLVLGFASRPGAYYVEPAAGVATVVALAGGASPDGDLRRIRVVRDGREFLANAIVESAPMQGPVQSGDQIYVGRRGWFDRNSAFFVSAVVSLAGIAVTLIVAR